MPLAELDGLEIAYELRFGRPERFAEVEQSSGAADVMAEGLWRFEEVAS